MGIRHSTDQHSLPTVEDSKLSTKKFSDLYIACSENDLDLVRILLDTSPFEHINIHEINGSTALHIAVQLGHASIVRYLLNNCGVCRHRTDSQGHTAFQLASTDEIRQLFRRPTSDENRFCNAQLSSTQITFFDSVPNDADDVPPGRVEGHQNFLTLREHHMKQVHAHYGSDRSPSLKIKSEKWLSQQREIVSNLIDQSIQSNDIQYRKAKELLKEYSQNGRADPLIHLYTLPTSFCSSINQNKESSERLALPIYNALAYLHPRAFQGVSYRGLSMSSEDLQAYRWAEKKPSRSLVINTFCSTTRDISVAEAFAEAARADGRIEVLMIWNFPTRCLAAIQLERLSVQLPCISEMEDEQEILILPRTSFNATKVQSDSPRTTIYLQFSQLYREVDEYYNNLEGGCGCGCGV